MRQNVRLGRQPSRDWYRIETKASDASATDATTAAIYVYDEIGYWGVTAQDFVRELIKLDVTQIDLHLNSPGGDVFDGLAIYQALVDHKAQVTTVIDGLAASAASFIALAGDRVEIGPHAQMMIHDASGLAWGNAEEMRAMADRLDMISDNIASIYAARAGGEVSTWRSAMRAETWYGAAEAVAAGLADEVRTRASQDDSASVDPSPAAARARVHDLSVFRFAGRSAAPAPPLPHRQPVPPDPEALAARAITAMEAAYHAC